MTLFVRGCDAELKPLQRSLTEAMALVGEVLEYYGETEGTIAAVETLFKSIESFSKVYIVEERAQERAPGSNTPAKVKANKAVAA